MRPLLKPDGESIRLVCFPHAGGSPRSYLPWKSLLPSKVEVQTIPLPGRGYPEHVRRPQDFFELCANAGEQLTKSDDDRPYALFGHSMGALMAFEVARSLQQQKVRQPICLLVSGCQAPQHWRAREERTSRPDAEIIAELIELGGTPDELIQHPEMMDLLLPLLRFDYRMIDSYLYQPTRRLSLPVAVLAGTEDPYVRNGNLNGWEDVTTEAVETKLFSGGHFFIQSEVTAVLDFVCRFLSNHRGRHSADHQGSWA